MRASPDARASSRRWGLGAAAALALAGHILLGWWLDAPVERAARTAPARIVWIAGSVARRADAGPDGAPVARHGPTGIGEDPPRAAPPPADTAPPAPNRDLDRVHAPRPQEPPARAPNGLQRPVPVVPPPRPHALPPATDPPAAAAAQPPPVPQQGPRSPVWASEAPPPPIPALAPDDDDPLSGLAPDASSGAAPDPEALRRLPVYPTALPAPFERRYRLRQGGGLSGDAVLRFETNGPDGGYRLRLDAMVGDRPGWQQDSRGATGTAGLQPRQFDDRRGTRTPRSTQFDRDAGIVRVGRRGRPHVLAAAGQDRLSWWVQLPAIVRARAGGPRAGERLSLQVAGTRGSPVIWHFENRGLESRGAGDEGPPGTWHFVRLPERPYDLQIDVWLDPREDFLPARARLLLVPGDWWLDLAFAGP